ncbi:MAG: Mur ligase domain-containing protein [Dissulfurispiraceae bacterium]|jgi:UDP-N-acetylmuramate--alanine ligase|nr:Mur ligase domain-containing protein [Dissulfurispiraceae bacterium]
MKLYFSGIGGAGMSSLALFMAENGHIVSGSDRAFGKEKKHPVYDALVESGINIVSQDGDSLDCMTDVAVFSTAVEKSSPDFQKALSMGIKIKTRPEMLAEMVLYFRTIAVAGTSGKSTTSGMLAFIMGMLGMQPNFIGGGRVKHFKSETNPGNYLTGRSRWLVIEACESDGTIVNYSPEYSLITNLALDHHDINTTKEMFMKLVSNTKNEIFINCDDSNLADLSGGKVIGYSLDAPSGFKPQSYILHELSSEMRIKDIDFRINLPGRHNLYNALGCLAILDHLGVDLAAVSEVLQKFRGIDRRFDIHLNSSDKLVVDDYAHNPHKIEALMESVSAIKKSVCYVFQPHGYSPTRLMLSQYINTFASNLRDEDLLVLLPIYYAGGTVQDDISSADIASGVKAMGKNAVLFSSRNELASELKGWNNIIILGARDESLSVFASEVAQGLSG